MSKLSAILFTTVTALSSSVSGCRGFDPANPLSSAPLERAIAKMANPGCEKQRQSLQDQVKQAHGKGTAAPAFSGNWRCRAGGSDAVEVWYVQDTGTTADGVLSSWENDHQLNLGLSPEVKQNFQGIHDGNGWVFFSEDAEVDFAGKLAPNGQELRGQVIVRNAESCQSHEYSCAHM